MPSVIAAEGALLERVLESEYRIAPQGLSRRAFDTLHAAMSRTTWGAACERRHALVDGDEVLASAMVRDLAAVLDGRQVRVCGISRVRGRADGETTFTQELVAQLVRVAGSAGADVALLRRPPGSDAMAFDGFTAIPLTDLELSVAQSARHGAPMTLVRGGEDRDLAAIAMMGSARAGRFRFGLVRNADYIKHVITNRRLLAGVGPPGMRELQFVIAEEGITAAAYVVFSVSGQTWMLEECGDRDPSGARVGALLQALIAREPSEKRPTIRAWLPPGFLPPQITGVEARPSADALMVRSLASSVDATTLSSDDVLWWHADS